MLLHGFQKRRLRFRRGAVDLVGQQNVGEDRTALKLKTPSAFGRLQHDVGADQVRRHQVRRKLDALKLQVQRLGQSPHQQRLAQPRHAFQQHMPAGNQGC